MAMMIPIPNLSMFLSETILRLIVAAVLGGIIGLDREMKHKPAGLRTNMFICFGAAMFTVLSFRFAGDSADHTRIASNIIPGIGFIGAGSILHSRGSVTGLTTAATMFVVASIGMAVGGGEYLPAIFATVVIVLALNLLGWVEQRFNFKSELMGYAVTAKDPELMIAEVNRILEQHGVSMRTVQIGKGADSHRVHFTVEAKHSDHLVLASNLRANAALDRVELLRSAETE